MVIVYVIYYERFPLKMADYIRDLRKILGHRKIIHPAARIILENPSGEILLI